MNGFPNHIKLPDAEMVCINYLLNNDAVQDIVSDRVSTELPRNIVYPYLLIERIGSIPVDSRWLDNVEIQVSSWASTKRDAFDLASTARVALLDMGDGYRDDIDGAYVTGVQESFGLLWLPDDSQTKPIPRYLFGISVYLHP